MQSKNSNPLHLEIQNNQKNKNTEKQHGKKECHNYLNKAHTKALLHLMRMVLQLMMMLVKEKAETIIIRCKKAISHFK